MDPRRVSRAINYSKQKIRKIVEPSAPLYTLCEVKKKIQHKYKDGDARTTSLPVQGSRQAARWRNGDTYQQKQNSKSKATKSA